MLIHVGDVHLGLGTEQKTQSNGKSSSGLATVKYIKKVMPRNQQSRIQDRPGIGQ